MKENMNFFVVPHTHWDREWYMPFEHFRIILGRTIDDIVDHLEKNKNFKFSLDGQAVILEDYLEIRPYQKKRLVNLVKAGQIAVGPAYVLPDEYLPGGESLIRNLLIGHQVCQELGMEPMKVGYFPDPFGHIEQMPQILRGFGIDNFIFWRGLGNEGKDLGAVFNWEASNGDSVMAIRFLGKDGYGSIRTLGHVFPLTDTVVTDPKNWPQVVLDTVEGFVERHKSQFKISGINDILLANGSDHLPIQKDLPQLLESIHKAHPEWTFTISTYEEYVDQVRKNHGPLKSYNGELCSGREAPILRGINSTRMYLKQENELTERAMFMAESLNSLAKLYSEKNNLGYGYPLWELRYAWKELIKNHPHDSISGCSVDEVYKSVMHRFMVAQQVAKKLQNEALAVLAGNFTRDALHAQEDILSPENFGENRSFVNVLPFKRIREVKLSLPPGLNGDKLIAQTQSGLLPVQIDRIDNKKIVRTVVEIDGLSSESLQVRKGLTDVEGVRLIDNKTIENEFYQVKVLDNGSISLTDQKSGDQYSGLHIFEDQADNGDEYTFGPTKSEAWDSQKVKATIKPLSKGPLIAELQVGIKAKLPKALQPNRQYRTKSQVICPIRTIIRLIKGVDRVEFLTTIENKAKDHRLRVVFDTSSADLQVFSEGHFAVTKRSVKPIEYDTDWAEYPTPTQHNLGLVNLGKLVLFNKGLPEYEAIEADKTKLALTLVRCVGWMSLNDGEISTRPVHAGPKIPTPEAQCLGKHQFEYAISLRGESSDADLIRASQSYRMDFVNGPAGIDIKNLLKLSGENFVVSALKRSEDGKGTILRVYNPGETEGFIKLGGIFKNAYRCRIDETEIGKQAISEVKIKPYEIVTLYLK